MTIEELDLKIGDKVFIDNTKGTFFERATVKRVTPKRVLVQSCKDSYCFYIAKNDIWIQTQYNKIEKLIN
jgi:uncharacterized protein YneR